VVNTSTGTFPGTLPSGATLPTAELNTLADVLEACINSKGGVANDGSTSCGSLFGLTPNAAGTTNPTDTITAAMNIAQNPARNVAQLNSIAGNTPAFEPNLGTAPSAWTVAINYTGGGLNQPTTIAADQSGNIWVGNSGSEAVSLFDNLGNSKLGTTGTTLGGTPQGVAIDLTGDAWVTASNSEVYELNSSGANTNTLTGNGLNLPTGIAIDPSGVIWVANSGSGANSVSAFTSTGATLAGSPFTGAGIASPTGIAINASANANCANCK
jgi:streptogramin lyase